MVELGFAKNVADQAALAPGVQFAPDSEQTARDASARDPLPGVSRRAIVVTHGVGDQRRGDELDTVVEPLIAFLGKALGHERVRLKARTLLDDDGIAAAVIHLTSPDGTVLEEWQVREAWWADTFRVSPTRSVLFWSTIQFVFHTMATVEQVIGRNIQRFISHALGSHDQATGPWDIRVSHSLLIYFINILSWAIISSSYVFIYVLGIALIVPAVVVLSLPALIWPKEVGQIQTFFISLLTGGIGDQQAMTTRRVALAAAANTISTALWPFIAPEARKKRAYDFDTVTLIAHSGGCVVSYEALAGLEGKRWLDPEAIGASADDGRRRVTWITVGSGLNLAWNSHPPKHAKDEAFWNRSISKYVNWIDIYARYDPVPQGEPPKEMVERLMGGSNDVPYVSIRVVNDDWPLSDHGAYWWNHEEVMSRIVFAIVNSKLAQSPLQAKEAGWEISTAVSNMSPTPSQQLQATLVQQVRVSVDAGSERRRRVATRRFVSMLMLLGVATVLLGVDTLALWLIRFFTMTLAAVAAWTVVERLGLPRWGKGWLILAWLGTNAVLTFTSPPLWAWSTLANTLVVLWLLVYPGLLAVPALGARKGLVLASLLVASAAILGGELAVAPYVGLLLQGPPLRFLSDAPLVAYAEQALRWQLSVPGLPAFTPAVVIPEQIARLGLSERERAWIFSVLAVAVLGLVAGILASLVASVVAWFKPERDRPASPGRPAGAGPRHRNDESDSAAAPHQDPT